MRQSDCERHSRRTIVVCAVVMVVAFALRWPSCSESFWVDELHTAWSVSGELSQVASRAKLGNQQPLYFGGMWVWQMAGKAALPASYPTEVWMRLSSVLATMLAAGLLAGLVSRTTGQWIGGLAAGLAMAIERNAIFFGTELRPYPFVILLCVLATAFAFWPTNPKTRFTLRLYGMHVSGILAAFSHLTSLMVIAPLLLLASIFLWRSSKENGKTPSFSQLIALLGIWATAAIVWANTQGSIWEARSNWESFATARSLWQVWDLWPWLALLVAPLIITWLTMPAGPSRPKFILFVVVAILVISTLGCFVLASTEFLPLWHRRYLIAGLPVLCFCFGLCVGWQKNATVSWLVLIVALSFVTYEQRTLKSLSQGQLRLAVRGEDWSRAISYISQNGSEKERVWVDPALIEQEGLPPDARSHPLADYLLFPISGPYGDSRLQWIPTGSSGTRTWLQSPQSEWLITRRSWTSKQAGPDRWRAQRFGRVWVLAVRSTD